MSILGPFSYFKAKKSSQRVPFISNSYALCNSITNYNSPVYPFFLIDHLRAHVCLTVDNECHILYIHLLKFTLFIICKRNDSLPRLELTRK